MGQSEPKLGVTYYLKLILASLGLIVGGGVLFALATMAGQVFPFVALVAVGMAILGALGLLLAVGVPILGFAGERWLFPYLERRAFRMDEERERGPNAGMLRYDVRYLERRQMRVDLGLLKLEPRPTTPAQQPIAPPPRQSVAPSSQRPTPPRRTPAESPAAPVSAPPSDSAITVQPQRPATHVPAHQMPPSLQPSQPARPPSSAPESEETPTPRPFVSPQLVRPTFMPVDIPGASPASQPRWSAESFAGLSLDDLLQRRQAPDGAAMGFAFQNLEIPDDITQAMNALDAEISRRGG